MRPGKVSFDLNTKPKEQRPDREGTTKLNKRGRPVVQPDLNPLVGDRGIGESAAAIMACNDWLRMGPSRSIAGLYRWYKRMDTYEGSRNSLYHFSLDFNWAGRAEIYDTKIEAEKNAAVNAILHSGLSEVSARVDKLKRAAAMLEEEMTRPDRLYLKDHKQLGQGQYSRLVTVMRFNAPLVEQYRGLLDDIAKEVGARQKSSGDKDVPININVRMAGLDDATEEMPLEGPIETIPGLEKIKIKLGGITGE